MSSEAAHSSGSTAQGPDDYQGEVHEYDGILEHDNNLPNWWLVVLFGTMVFSVGYWMHYQVIKSGPSIAAAFDQDMAADRAAAAERARQAGAMTPEVLTTLSKDPSTVADGRAVYTQNCVACHGPGGGGVIGPNLTDNAWIHGGAADKIFRTVLEGIPAKGMPAWGAQLGPQRVANVVAFLLTIKNTNVAGKPPQGNREE